MTLRADLETSSGEETQERLSWRAWLLLPLAFVALVGIVVPFTRPNPLATNTNRQPLEEDLAEDLVPYSGELTRYFDRGDIPAVARNVIKRFHSKIKAFADEHDGLIRSKDRKKVDMYLDLYR